MGDMNTVTREELLAKVGSPRCTVVNVLAPESYSKIHIKGSVSIPRLELEQGRWKELDSSKEVVVYCSSYQCDASRASAQFLEGKGFDVSAYEGGIKEWAEAGLPTEGALSARDYLQEKYGKQATASPSAT